MSEYTAEQKFNPAADAEIELFSAEPDLYDAEYPAAICPGLGAAARAGQAPRDGEPLVTGIVQSTTFAREGVDSTAEHQYSRVSNPTVATLEDALGRLERAEPAISYSTGLAAESGVFLTLLRAGDHVVCGRAVYGGTTRLLRQVLAGLGVQSTFVDAIDVSAVERAITPATRLIFIETPANPSLELTDIEAIGRVAHRAGALLAVDNTFLTAILQRPLDLGADISVYSTTKFVEGHSAALGGALVTRDRALATRLRFIRKSIGAIQTPFNAWLTLQGLRTLPVRITHQSANAAAVAHWLASREDVPRVYYPGLAKGRDREIALRQHRLGAGGAPLGHAAASLPAIHGAVVSFDLGSATAARRFVAALRRIRLVEHVGSIETLITHSASMTHADVPPDQKLACGVTDGLLRLSIGLEPPQAIIQDLRQALESLRSPATTQEPAHAAA
jgi:cystathionine beta-lyase/cystathionine gamma-synthase